MATSDYGKVDAKHQGPSDNCMASATDDVVKSLREDNDGKLHRMSFCMINNTSASF